jgi:hypothetical protein
MRCYYNRLFNTRREKLKKAVVGLHGEEIKPVQGNLVGKTLRKRSLENLLRTCEDNIAMFLRADCEEGRWMEVIQFRVH